MNTFFLPTLSTAINAYLHLDPESLTRLQMIQGKIIAIELLPFKLKFQCIVNANGISIMTNNEHEPDTYIKGTPLQMAGVMFAKENRQRFFADDLEMTGDAVSGQQIISLFDELSIDWEDYLARVTGDIPAYHTGRVLRNVTQWLQKTSQSLQLDMTEYLQEETGWLPTREALQDLFNDIDLTRMDVDRLEAKLHLLSARILADEEIL